MPLTYLIIEDEPAIRKLLMAGLADDEVKVITANTAAEGLRLAARNSPDVVLLDLGLPDRDGLSLLRELREWSQVPVLVLSARGQESDKVAALDLGADDYLMKPFSMNELMARLRAAIRRSPNRQYSAAEPKLSQSGLEVDFEARTVRLDGEEVRLTPVEYRLLTLLAQNAGKVMTQKQLLREVWGPEFEDSTHTLRVHMANLRHKIELDSGRPTFIRTETGVGYRWLIAE